MFKYSTKATSFQFSAKTQVITLPEFTNQLPQNEQELIQQLAELSRDLYVKRVVELSKSIGEKICAIKIRSACIKEAIATLDNPELEQALSHFSSLKPKRTRSTMEL